MRSITHDTEALRRAAGRNPNKAAAMEMVKPAPVIQELKPQPPNCHSGPPASG
jgi:hypothetical protein